MLGSCEADYRDLSGNNWFYLRSLLRGNDKLSIEELLAEVPDSPRTDDEQLAGVADKLNAVFEK